MVSVSDDDARLMVSGDESALAITDAESGVMSETAGTEADERGSAGLAELVTELTVPRVGTRVGEGGGVGESSSEFCCEAGADDVGRMMSMECSDGS